MLDVTIQERTTVRFEADRLPASKRPIVVVRKRGRGDPLEETLDADTVILTLQEDASLREARELAEHLNEQVERVGAATVGT